jgi:hypothetical protein
MSVSELVIASDRRAAVAMLICPCVCCGLGVLSCAEGGYGRAWSDILGIGSIDVRFV